MTVERTKRTPKEIEAEARAISSRAAEFEQRNKLWHALAAHIQSNGGWVTSLPGTKHLRFEVRRDSALPAKLIELGYAVRHSGTTHGSQAAQRIMASRRSI
jgi:N-acetylmuramoyl-L-alanine amidase